MLSIRFFSTTGTGLSVCMFKLDYIVISERERERGREWGKEEER